MALRAGESSTAGITLKADGLWISSDQMGGEHKLNWVDREVNWDFTADSSTPVDATEFLDNESLALLLGCKDANGGEGGARRISTFSR